MRNLESHGSFMWRSALCLTMALVAMLLVIPDHASAADLWDTYYNKCKTQWKKNYDACDSVYNAAVKKAGDDIDGGLAAIIPAVTCRGKADKAFDKCWEPDIFISKMEPGPNRQHNEKILEKMEKGFDKCKKNRIKADTKCKKKKSQNKAQACLSKANKSNMNCLAKSRKKYAKKIKD